MAKTLEHQNRILVWLIFTVATIFLFVRSDGLFPRIFADEYTYSYHSKFFGHTDAGIPSFLFYGVFSLTEHCGTNPLACARVLNILLFLIGGWFVFLTSRSWLDEIGTITITFASLFGAYSIYTHFYMPEAMFYAGIWWFIYTFLNIKSHRSAIAYLLPAALFGLLTLIKAHALLLLPAMVVFIALDNQRPSTAIKKVTLFLGVVVTVKLAVGYLLVGRTGITLFGPNYAAHAQTTLSSIKLVMEAWPSLLANGLGNLAALCLAYGVTIPLLLTCRVGEAKSMTPLNKLTILLFINSIFIVVLFTTTSAILGEDQDHRIYFRYYSYLFPLLFINAVNVIEKQGKNTDILANKLIAFFSMLLILAALYLYFSRYETLYPFKIFISDSPELYYSIEDKSIFVFISALSIASVALYLYQSKIFGKSYLAYIALLSIVYSYLSYGATREDTQAGSADLAGLFITENISKHEQNDLLVIGKTEYLIQNTLFYASSPRARGLVVQPDNIVDLRSLVDNNSNIIIIENAISVSTGQVAYEGDGFIYIQK